MAEEAAQSEEEMAEAMEAAAGDGGEMDMAAAMAEEGSDSLSQDEIDSLLGFDDATSGPKSGIQALLDKSLQSYERLPMLEVVFDRFVRTLSTSLRNFTSENVEANIDSITSMRFEDYLNSVPLPALMSIFQAVEWENFGLITVDSSLTYSMVEVLLGGGRTRRPIRIEGRPFTTIEQDIVRSFTDIMLEDLSAAFNPLTPATFRFERLETNPRFATITRPSNAIILLSLRIDMDDRGGKTEIVVPYATLEPIKDLLIQMFTGETFGADSTWEDHMTSEVQSTEVMIEAVLKPKKITLKELASLKVGTTILMDNGPNDFMDVECGKTKMLTGKIGAVGKKVALCVEEVYKKNIEGLL